MSSVTQADQQAAGRVPARAGRHGDDVPGHRRGRAEDRRRGRRDLAAARQDRRHLQGVLLVRRQPSGGTSATATLNVEPARAGLLAFNRGGTSTDLDVAFESFAVQSAGEVVPSLIAEAPGTVGGTVPATLSLTLGAAATFAPFVPGVAREYTAATTATVTRRPATRRSRSAVRPPGQRRVHPPPAACRSRSRGRRGTRPVVQRRRRRHVQAGDRRRPTPLRTGTYSKTLTFTLSTTSP